MIEQRLLTPSQQAAGEAAYLLASKRESAVANYPAIVAAIGEAVMAQYWADLLSKAAASRSPKPSFDWFDSCKPEEDR